MKFFLKKKVKKYRVLKLFKICTLDQSLSLSTYRIIDNIFSLLESISEDKLSYLELNYGQKTWKNIVAYKKYSINKTKLNVVSFLAVNNDKSQFVSISNPLLNFKEKSPEYGKVSIVISIEDNFFKSKIMEDFIMEIYNLFSFNYGYIVNLDEGYDWITERKIKKGLFTEEISIEAEDTIWQLYSMGIIDGYFKKIYPINFINQNQVRILKEINIEDIGDQQILNEHISMISLDENEIQTLTRKINSINYFINDNNFLASRKAENYKKKMSIE
ncbi:hypothetical protein [Aureispira anguillae]|uniref:Uncharacterized protein n=1 Tax=Aureispira anguillae TaxID=2864201 RepID=A0A915YF26_9BACT|nr:hypothetical protein [Aureispira anguillae]BDS11948.1 hypothetical protein AsAng_0026630 [Aureispira anguillae]